MLRISDIQEALQQPSVSVQVRGAGSKAALWPSGQTILDMTQYSGVVEYDPSEYVLVAKAGTPLTEVQTLLAQNGQYLPFDPPLAHQGATLGGTVAAGLSGAGRHRFGGVRDFVLGVQFVDGQGRVVRGGGKVVKNAAGFDLPKLMVGSLGRLGVITELAFKVFPQPPATASYSLEHSSFTQALQTLYQLANSPFEFYALDLEPTGRVVLQMGGPAQSLAARAKNLERFLGRLLSPLSNPLEYWQSGRELSFANGMALVKVALTASQAQNLEAVMPPTPRRYHAAANLLYLGWPNPLNDLHLLLQQQGLAGLVLRGDCQSALIGVNLMQAFGVRIKAALDPNGRLGGFGAT